MNISAPFIRRPVGTILLAVALLLSGLVAYAFLPVASLPAIDLPVIVVTASRAGADPATMAASVAAPLERRLAYIAGLSEMTSSSSLGQTQILVQFDLGRNIDFAARDVQAAINAAMTDLPRDLTVKPYSRKVNSTGSPVLTLALTSDTLPIGAVFDAADSVIAQRLARAPGVGQVRVAGAEQPAIRVQVDPSRLAAMGLATDKVADMLLTANTRAALGSFDGASRNEMLMANDQLTRPIEYRELVVAAARGAVAKLSDIAEVDYGVRDRRTAGWFNGKPAVLLLVTKQANANVVETVDGIKHLLADMEQWMPPGIDVSILSDRTKTIRASISEIEFTLAIAIVLVMAVILAFVRRVTPVVAAGVAVPLCLVGSCAAMWAAGFSLDNLSLMALTISVGFVIDDAIVVVENIERNVGLGANRMEAALRGAGEIGPTVVSLGASLIAAFVPLLLMGGIVGRALREFSLTLAFAIIISTIVSLTITPMICAWLPSEEKKTPSAFGRSFEATFSRLAAAYARGLRSVLTYPRASLALIVAVLTWTIYLYATTPKGNLPQDDIGLIAATTEASADVSFPEMARLQQQASTLLAEDPDVANVGSTIGASRISQGQLIIALKPPGVRRSTSAQVIERSRRRFAEIAGLNVSMVAAQDMNANVRQSKAKYQFSLSDASNDELAEALPKVLARLKELPEIVDVSSDWQDGGLKADVVIDRAAASRMGVSIAAIDSALNSAYGQRQDSIIYTQRNQYRVVYEVSSSSRADAADISKIHVPNAEGIATPLQSLARIERGSMAQVVNHQGMNPAATITYNLAPGRHMDEATRAVREAIDAMALPGGLHADFAGDAADFRKVAAGMPILIAIALAAVYVILGILYESWTHPIIIISTLPSAGLGALLALQAAHMELSVVAFIGILLLIGIVKKNGIILVDFALDAERRRGLDACEAVVEAAKERLRPILMTTAAAALGALPLVFAAGIGAEMRRPLGVTIVGGLLISQILTLYTTPVIYLLMSRARMPSARRLR